MYFITVKPSVWGLDEAEELLLFQRCLPATVECHAELSVAQSKLSSQEAHFFSTRIPLDPDLDLSLAMFDEEPASTVHPPSLLLPRRRPSLVMCVRSTQVCPLRLCLGRQGSQLCVLRGCAVGDRAHCLSLWWGQNVPAAELGQAMSMKVCQTRFQISSCARQVLNLVRCCSMAADECVGVPDDPYGLTPCRAALIALCFCGKGVEWLLADLDSTSRLTGAALMGMYQPRPRPALLAVRRAAGLTSNVKAHVLRLPMPCAYMSRAASAWELHLLCHKPCA